MRDARPGAPTDLQVAGVACTGAGTMVGTVTPTLSAILPDADAHESITGTWEWLYVNGVLVATTAQSYAWQANGSLTVGAAASAAPGQASELWFGGVDDVYAYRGAMTDAQVAELHDQQD